MFTASSEISIEFKDIKESIIFLHGELLSQGFADDYEQNFIGYAKNIRVLERTRISKFR